MDLNLDRIRPGMHFHVGKAIGIARYADKKISYDAPCQILEDTHEVLIIIKTDRSKIVSEVHQETPE